MMKTSPLHEIHTALGARFTEVSGWQVPAHYGDSLGEQLAVRKKVGLCDFSYRGRILITGIDRAKFLQGLITNDVMKLIDGQGLYAAILNPKGRMLADLKIYAIQETLLVDLDRAVTDKTVQILNRYKLVSKAKLEDLTDSFSHLALHGPLAKPILEKAIGAALPGPQEFSSTSTQWQGHPLHMIRSLYTGEDGYDLLLPKSEVIALWKGLFDAGLSFGIKPIGFEALESLRVEAGIPRYGVDMDENTFPPEAGLEEKAISYSKGCYVGQETIARIKTYGQVHRKLMGLILRGTGSSGEPAVNLLPHRQDKVLKDGEEIGFVTSAAYSAMIGQNIALAYIRRKSLQPNLSVTVEISQAGSSVPAQLVDLPFYPQMTQSATST